jgi:hypothetical protein
MKMLFAHAYVIPQELTANPRCLLILAAWRRTSMTEFISRYDNDMLRRLISAPVSPTAPGRMPADYLQQSDLFLTF